MSWILIRSKGRQAEYAIYYFGQLVETVVLTVGNSIEQYVKENYGELLHLNDNE